MEFNKSYTNYWENAVVKSIDGTAIAGQNQVRYFMDQLKIDKNSKILDLGCSFGRMYDVLSEYSDCIYGVDPDKYAVSKAKEYSYKEVKEGSAENTGFEENKFDFVFCWAVFDVVDHIKGLCEINRVLKSGGQLLLTGKNNKYYSDDLLAFNAEKNAYIKKFPGKYTNLELLTKEIKVFGFEIVNSYIFPRRGDFGISNFINTTNLLSNDYIGYEYLIECRKIGGVELQNIQLEIENKFSITSMDKSVNQGFDNVSEYFHSIGIS
jgi:ubiquinone/menaquinone biosynthesis C-methylase UbiE